MLKSDGAKAYVTSAYLKLKQMDYGLRFQLLRNRTVKIN